MKGISTILAMILIVIIVVALIGLTYTFAANLFTTTTTAASNSTASVTTNIQKSVYILNGATCTADGATGYDFVNFTVQDTGTLQINAGDMGAAFDGGDISSNATTGTNTINAISLLPGKAASLSAIVLKVAGRTTRTLTVSAPAGDVSYTFTNCP